MKKLTALLLVLALFFSFAACSDSPDAQPVDGSLSSDEYSTNATASGASLSIELNTGMKEKFDKLEYAAYYNLFYNQDLADVDKKLDKDGVFTKIYDAYNQTERYYVWGYLDNTKCCSYQWEFVMPEGTDIPEPGSYVKMSGKLTQDSAALDGYWFTDVTLEVTDKFENAGFDFDMTTLSRDLTRVQVLNMLQFPTDEHFNNKTLRVFGRALTTNSIQDPYYDNCWSMDFTYDGDAPAIGSDIFLQGTFTGTDAGSVIKAENISLIG